MSFVCHSYVLVCHSYVTPHILSVCTRKPFVCNSYVLVGYLYVTCIYSHVMTCHSYVLVCHPYVTRMYSCVIPMSLACTIMSSLYHSYVLVCHPYVTRMYSYVTRMLLVCNRMSSVCHLFVVLPWTMNSFDISLLSSFKIFVGMLFEPIDFRGSREKIMFLI